MVPQTAALIQQHAPAIRDDVVASLVASFAPFLSRYHLDTKALTEYLAFDLDYLRLALLCSRPELYTGYLSWLGSMLAGHGLPAEVIVPVEMQALRTSLAKYLNSEQLTLVEPLLGAGLLAAGVPSRVPQPFVDPDAPHGSLAVAYLNALLASDRRSALGCITEAARGEVPVEALYLHVLQPVQHELGRRWQIGEITVAHEHFATSVTQLAMAHLAPLVFDASRELRDLTLVATCVDDELHEVGLRMVCDVFEMAGWDTVFIGANAPTEGIVAMVEEKHADVLALSVSMIVHVDRVRDVVAALKRRGLSHVKVLAGGYPFRLAPELALLMGAHGTAMDAQGALRVAEALVQQ